MPWGCVAASGTGNTAQVDGRMNSSKDQQVLVVNMTYSVKKLKLNISELEAFCKEEVGENSLNKNG